MESLADRARRVLRGHGSPVVPLSTVVHLLRTDGCAVTEWVLLRAMEADRNFRLVHPWRGSLSFLVETDPGGCAGRRPGEPDPRHVMVLTDAGSAPAAARGAQGHGVLNRMRRSLVLLGRSLDERSLLDRARWLAMLAEAGRMQPA